MERRKNIENIVFKKTEKVRDLQAQLVKAEEELTDAEISLADIFDQEKKLPLKIKGIEDDIEKYIEELGHHES
jgi:phage shock protein A